MGPWPSRSNCRLLAGAVVALLTILGGCGDGGNESSPRAVFGVNGHHLRFAINRGEAEQMALGLDSLEGSGVDFVRADVDWRGLQPAAPGPPPGGDFEFAILDRWVTALAERGLRWQPVLGLFVPTWAADPASLAAGCGSRSAPAADALPDYSAAYAAVAGRYGSDGRFWDENPELPYRPIEDYEVWNEPNNGGTWCPRPDPKRYAQLYADARAALHSVDGNATVLFGGLGGIRTNTPAEGLPIRQAFVEFLSKAIEALERPIEIDALAAHSYGPPLYALENLALYRSTLDDFGLDEVPISLNEFGWTTVGAQATTESERVAFMRQLVPALAAGACGVSALAPYAWTTSEADPRVAGDFFGLADPATGGGRPSGLAYLALSAVTTPAEPPALCATGA